MSCVGPTRRALPGSVARPQAGSTVATSSTVSQLPWAGMVTSKVSPPPSTVAGAEEEIRVSRR